jgi:hypothetical protein
MENARRSFLLGIFFFFFLKKSVLADDKKSWMTCKEARANKEIKGTGDMDH